MTKNSLNAILIGLLAVLAMACGAPAADSPDAQNDFGEGLGEEEVADVDAEDIDEDEEPIEEDGEDIGDGEEEEEIEAPFCGDGVVDDGEECDDGNPEDGDGCSSFCEIEVFQAEAQGEIAIELIVDDLSSNEAPLETGCADAIALEVDDRTLVGEGRCFLPANFLDYTIDAEVDEDGAVEGEITIVLNNRPNVLPISGTLEDGVLTIEFDGVTLLVGNIRGVWNGTIAANFD